MSEETAKDVFDTFTEGQKANVRNVIDVIQICRENEKKWIPMSYLTRMIDSLNEKQKLVACAMIKRALVEAGYEEKAQKDI